MSRYVTSAAYRPLFVETPLWEPPNGGAPNLSVDGAKRLNTGLVSARGEPIMRLQDPIGFGRENER